MDTLTHIPLDALVWYVGLLDRIPDYWRAMIAGTLLVLMLAYSRRKVPPRDVQFSISFAKTSLIVLAVTPLVVWLLPVSRFNVLVERLEPAAPAHLVWLSALGVWLAGFLVGAGRLLTGTLRARASARVLPALADDHKLSGRLKHWQRRLGISRSMTIATSSDATLRYLPGARRVVLPRAVEHWPTPAADVLIIQALCRMTKHQGRWHLLAQLVACAYWPVPWVRQVHERLMRDFHIATDTLAAACYQDDLGYQRALQQMEQRLGPTAGSSADGAESTAQHFAGVQAYRNHLGACFQPQPGIEWSAQTLKRVHDERRGVVWSEPGEKLAFLVAQAVLVALLVGGVTLKEIPPEVEQDYSITLDPDWMDTAFRDPSRYSAPPKPRTAGDSNSSGR